MKMAIATNTKQVLQNSSNAKQNLLIDIALALLVAVIIAGLNMFWFSFDHHFPMQDEAEHIMNSIVGKELIGHSHLFSQHWWYSVLTINCYYPPFAYMVNGAFLLLFGQSRFTEQLSLTFFVGLMVIGVYGTLRQLSGSRLAAVLSACCLVAYPLIAELSHRFFLDLPEVAMTAISLMTLLWWRSNPLPNWKRTIVTAVVIALSCLTKQLVAAYLIPVGLYYLVIDSGIFNSPRVPKWNWLRHTIVMGLVVAAIGLPFILINYKATQTMTSMIVKDFALQKNHWTYIDRLILYLPLIPQAISWLLLILAAASLVIVKRVQQIRLMPITLSAIGGLGLMLAWPGNSVDIRYLAPLLIAPAIYTGLMLDRLFYSDNHGLKVALGLINALAVINYIGFNFEPYPFRLPKSVQDFVISQAHVSPTPESDWGHSLVIDTIKKADGNNPVYLNVLTNMGTMHVHSFELLLKEEGNNTIKPTTARHFTVLGDKIEFKPKDALQCQWYLWKTGSVGYKFYDKQSESNFNQLVEFIQKSNNYKLMLQKTLPDGSQLMLYRRKT